MHSESARRVHAGMGHGKPDKIRLEDEVPHSNWGGASLMLRWSGDVFVKSTREVKL